MLGWGFDGQRIRLRAMIIELRFGSGLVRIEANPEFCCGFTAISFEGAEPKS
jgi:hypothetical protein